MRDAITISWLLAVLLTSGCRRQQAEEPKQLRYFGTTGLVTMAELAEDLGYLRPLKLEYLGGVLGGPEAIQAVSTRDVDFGNAAIGSVIKLIATGAPVRQVVASNGVDELSWNGFFVAEDSPIQSARDLIGKKVAMNTLGAHSEFMLREYLRRAGLSRAEMAQVSLVVIPPVNGEMTLRRGQVEVASLSSVFRDRAMQRGGLRVLFSDKSLFGSFNSVDTVFHSQFLAQHPRPCVASSRAWRVPSSGRATVRCRPFVAQPLPRRPVSQARRPTYPRGGHPAEHTRRGHRRARVRGQDARPQDHQHRRQRTAAYPRAAGEVSGSHPSGAAEVHFLSGLLRPRQRIRLRPVLGQGRRAGRARADPLRQPGLDWSQLDQQLHEQPHRPLCRRLRGLRQGAVLRRRDAPFPHAAHRHAGGWRRLGGTRLHSPRRSLGEAQQTGAGELRSKLARPQRAQVDKLARAAPSAEPGDELLLHLGQ